MAISILYFIDFLNVFSGTEKHLYDLLRNIDRSKFKPFVVTFEGTEEFKKKIEELKIPVKILKLKKIYGIKPLITLLGLIKFVRKHKIRIVQTFHTNPDIYGTILAILCGVPVIVSSRRDMGFNRNKRNLICYKLLNSSVDKIICVSEAVKKFVMQEEGVHEDKIKVIYNGLKSEDFYSNKNILFEKKKNKIQEAAPVVGILANFNPIKGHMYFFESLKLIRKVLPNIQCILIGGGLPVFEDELRLKVKELKIENCVHFLGYRRDISDVIPLMDVLVVPSLSEGFSNAIIEALYMSKPVIATNVGGNPEAIIHESTGVLVPPKDPAKMASAVINLFRNRKFAEELGNNGKKLVESKFLIQKMISETEELYSDLLSRKGITCG